MFVVCCHSMVIAVVHLVVRLMNAAASRSNHTNQLLLPFTPAIDIYYYYYYFTQPEADTHFTVP